MWIFAAQTTGSPNIVELIFKGVIDNPGAIMLAVALVIFYFATRGMRDELSKSREMLNGILTTFREERTADSNQQTIALNMATNAINKIDGVVTSINGMSDAMRQNAAAQLASSENHLASADKIAASHVTTTTLLVERIAAMDKLRAEDEIYANDRLMVQVDTKLTQHEEKVGLLIGQVLGGAAALHEETRKAFTEVLMAALLATPPTELPSSAPPPPENKSESETP